MQTEISQCLQLMSPEDDQKLLEALEDEGLYRAMNEVRHETPLSLEDALAELEQPSLSNCPRAMPALKNPPIENRSPHLQISSIDSENRSIAHKESRIDLEQS